MMLPFAGWSAHKIVGSINQKEVQAAILGHEIEGTNFWIWDSIEQMILRSSDDMKVVLHECGVAKANIEKQHQLIGVK